jgi:hypothetical protein
MNKFKTFGVMLDCSRNAVPTVEFLKTFIDDLAKMGYNSLQLYTEDTYEIDGEPMFGYLRGRFTKEEMKEINAYAKTRGVEMIPCIQTLAHLNCAVRWYPYCAYTDCDDILLIDDDRTYTLIDKMFATMRECYDTKYINIGMDEAHNVGLGQYLSKHGFQNRFEIILKHLKKVADIAKKYDFTCIMWSDMWFRLSNNGSYYSDKPFDIPQSIKDSVPDNVALCYWDYYTKNEAVANNMLAEHKKFNAETWFAGGAWSWGGFTPANYASMDSSDLTIRACIKNKVDNVFITMWGDNGGETSKRAVYPALFHAAQIAQGIDDVAIMNENFKNIFGVSMEDYLLIDSANRIQEMPTLNNYANSSPNNPSKYMFYNDPFLGIFDTDVNLDAEKYYVEYTEELKKMVENDRFGYIFDTQQKLCAVLADKYALGVKTRNAYKAGDKETLKNLVPVYDGLEQKILDFYNAFKAQWFKENKPFGFEIQDRRFGGAILRNKHCKERLIAYVNGEISQIPELEVKIESRWLDPSYDGKTGYDNWYTKIITANVE